MAKYAGEASAKPAVLNRQHVKQGVTVPTVRGQVGDMLALLLAALCDRNC